MPAAILTPADVEAVKATAIACQSLKLAAEAHNIDHAHCRMLASRGKWPVGYRLGKVAKAAQEQAREAVVQRQPRAVAVVTSPAEAAANVLAELGHQTRIGLSRAAASGATAAAQLTGEEVLAAARNIKDLTATAAQLHGWSGTSQPVQVNILAHDAVVSL